MNTKVVHAASINPDRAVVIFVDIQEKFMGKIHNEAHLIKSVTTLAKATRIMNLPFVVTEQYPEGLGRTIEPVRQILDPYYPVEKTAFGCCGDVEFIETIKEIGRDHFIICGIETHVCVLQTVIGLLTFDTPVFVVADGVTSRFEKDSQLALRHMELNGAQVIPLETCLFELLYDAKNPYFKEVQALIK